MKFDFVVIGAGAAGLTAAEELRRLAPEKSLCLINGEDRLPYKRTKLSKFLAQGWEKDDFAIYPHPWYTDQGITLLQNIQVESLSPGEGTALLSDGRTLGFGKVLLALGSAAGYSPAPGLREAREGEALRELWREESTITILGGGILGVELVEQAALMGKKGILITRSGSLLKGKLTPAASRRLEDLLESRGIRVVQGTGALHPCQAAAIGTPPRVDLGIRAGLAFDLGIQVDLRFRTSEPSVWAAGDCCQLPGGHVCHLWHEAEAQGQYAARDMAGQGENWPFTPYREKLEVFGDFYFSMGMSTGAPFREVSFRGPEGRETYQAWYGTEEKISGVVMAGDKIRAKIYEQAVREGWSWENVGTALGEK